MSPRAKPSAATVEPAAKETPKRRPKVTVLERRLQNPFGEGSRPIVLKEQGEPMVTRWVSEDSRPGRMDIAKNVQGWEPVTKDELADPEAVQGLAVAPDGTVRRGERMKVHLMKMPQAAFEAIQMAKARQVLARQQSSARTKEDIAQAAAEKYGPQAGDYLDSVITGKGEITESTERVER